METILNLLKIRLGITSDKRDVILTALINGVLTELKEIYGYTLNTESPDVIMFIVDLCDWRYSSRGETGDMPRHLRFRFHNLDVSQGGEV